MFILGVLSHVLAVLAVAYGYRAVKGVVTAPVIVWKSG